MRSYQELLSLVLGRGQMVPTRARIGDRQIDALSVFGAQWRHDLREGFPILTTKHVWFKGVVAELLWFLSGSTDVRDLQKQGVGIWDAWADKNGNLGPVYGHQFRRWGARPVNVPQPRPQIEAPHEATYLGVANGAGKERHPLAKTWEGMISRCYDPNNPSYPLYGARGVSVCNRWLWFANFAADAEHLPGWSGKKQNMRHYVLDKDGVGDGWTYGPNHCQWITPAENADLRAENIITVRRITDGQEFSFTSATRFAAEHEFSPENFSDLWTGNKNAKIRNGFKLVDVKPIRPGIDQIAALVAGIRETVADPRASIGRRLILSAWNVADIGKMALPPCHMMAQFSVRRQAALTRVPGASGGVNTSGVMSAGLRDMEPGAPEQEPAHRLSCHVYMRSADLFLGVPFNIASYALLTHMLAHVTGCEVGELIFSFGDLHLYQNHLTQAEEQLMRRPGALPRLAIHGRGPLIEGHRSGLPVCGPFASVDDITADDIELIGYEHQGTMRGEVAV